MGTGHQPEQASLEYLRLERLEQEIIGASFLCGYSDLMVTAGGEEEHTDESKC